MSSRPAAGGGRWVEVDPERLDRWLAGFAERHGAVEAVPGQGVLVLRAADGETAGLYPPPGAQPTDDLSTFPAAAAAPRRLGLVLIRRGGYAVGVADGAALRASKVDSRYVQGRTAAGGWSQQRFARRRDNQTRALVEAAADVVARLLLPECHGLAAVVAGGDRRLADELFADGRLGPVVGLRAERFLDVGDPKLAVLQAAVRGARAIRIHLS